MAGEREGRPRPGRGGAGTLGQAALAALSSCACWLEHLRGVRYWSEVDRGDFGLLRDAGGGLVAEVVEMLRGGRENLDVILWAADAGAPVGEVLRILEALDINSRRLPHRLDL